MRLQGYSPRGRLTKAFWVPLRPRDPVDVPNFPGVPYTLAPWAVAATPRATAVFQRQPIAPRKARTEYMCPGESYTQNCILGGSDPSRTPNQSPQRDDHRPSAKHRMRTPLYSENNIGWCCAVALSTEVRPRRNCLKRIISLPLIVLPISHASENLVSAERTRDKRMCASAVCMSEY